MIKVIVENPQSHTSKELRHLIHYLSCVAADIESRTGEGFTPSVHIPEGTKLTLSNGEQLEAVGGWIKLAELASQEETRIEGHPGPELHLPPAGTAPALADVVELRQEIQAGLETIAAHVTTLAEDVATAEAATVPNAGPVDYGVSEVLPPLGTAITQDTLPPVEYEIIVTGYAPGPVPFAEGHTRESYEAANWTVQMMLDAGHLVEVTEQRPLPVAPSALAALSAPAPTTVTAPAPSAPSSSDAVEVDKDGLPWDARIHSNAEVRKAATGKWKRRKNLTDDYVAGIEAELRALMAVGKPQTVATAPAPVTVTTATAAPTPPAPAAPPAPDAAPAVPAPAVPGAAPSTFAELTKWLMGHINAKNLEQSHVQVALREIGLKSLPDLNTRPDLIPVFTAKIEADYL